MKMPIILSVITATMLAACGSDDAERSLTAAPSDSASIESIAGDKSQVARVLARAHARGTFDDAMAEAFRDSALAAEAIALLRADPRFALADAPAAPLASSATSKSTTAKPVAQRSARKGSASGTTSRSSGDALDKAESEAKRVNERLDQAARVKKEAEQAKRTVEDIFGRR